MANVIDRSGAGVEGLGRVLANLLLVKQSLGSKILRQAMTQAVRPLARLARDRCPVGETGLLKKSIGYLVKTDRRAGVVYGIVGPRRGRKKDRKTGKKVLTNLGKAYEAAGVNPVRYAHLVEFGTVRSRARPFLRPAWDVGRAAAATSIATDVRDAVARSLR